ncbi:MAG TPA: response regulator [Pyrinomonadaceae bacterium]|nr:response regulator [Pyrinomonadaceae bacterium]
MSSILVVATAELRLRLVTVLRQAGYSVSEADSGESALTIALSAPPKLILMAIVMPDGNGLEVAARLRRNANGESPPPIILLGSVTPIGINEEPLASLVSGYLNSDVSRDDLLAAVRSRLAMDNQSEKSN